MNLPILVPGILISAAGLACVLYPQPFVRLAEGLLAHRATKWLAGGVRVLLGALILAGSGATPYPVANASLGGLLVVVGVVLLSLSRPRFEAIIRWGIGLAPGAIRLASLVAVMLGGWLCYTATGAG